MSSEQNMPILYSHSHVVAVGLMIEVHTRIMWQLSSNVTSAYVRTVVLLLLVVAVSAS